MASFYLFVDPHGGYVVCKSADGIIIDAYGTRRYDTGGMPLPISNSWQDAEYGEAIVNDLIDDGFKKVPLQEFPLAISGPEMNLPMPDPISAARAAAEQHFAAFAAINPALDMQSIRHAAHQAAASWLAAQGVTKAQFVASSGQDPISVAYATFVTAFVAQYAALREL